MSRLLMVIPLSAFLAATSMEWCAEAAAAGEFRTVAFQGDPAPGVTGGVGFSGFEKQAIDSAGRVAFKGSIPGLGLARGIWSEGDSGLELVARTSGPAPGTGANFFSIGNTLVINDAGETAFLGTISGTGVGSNNNSGIWSEGGGAGLRLVAREGSQAPGVPAGGLFGFFITGPALNDAGQSVLYATLTGAGVDNSNNRGLWSEGGGAVLALVARSGDPAPGTGAAFSGDFNVPVINNVGQVAFHGHLAGVDSSVDRGIWSEGGVMGLALVARSGEQAPGAGLGVNFDTFSATPGFNGAAQTTFRADLVGAGVNEDNNAGIWSEGGGTGPALVVRKGDVAPGTSVNFGQLTDPVINGAGQVAFRAFLDGTGVTDDNDFGIWSEGRGRGLELVVRTGERAPGTPDGVVFADLVNTTPALNAAGQTAFLGQLAGPGISRGNDRGIWAEDRSGVLRLVEREGDVIDVDNDPAIEDLHTVTSLSFLSSTGNEDGRTSSFNDAGQLAFYASFNNSRQGVFVSNLVAVPEPGSLWLAAGWLGLAVLSRTTGPVRKLTTIHRCSCHH